MSQSSLILRPAAGAEQIELVHYDGSGIWLAGDGNESLIPPPAHDESYAESPDTVGGRRLASRPQNPAGAGKVFIAADDPWEFQQLIRRWQEVVEATRRNGGEVVYTPPEGATVSYDLESIRLTSLAQERIRAGLAESEFEVTYRPYGRLDPYEPTLRGFNFDAERKNWIQNPRAYRDTATVTLIGNLSNPTLKRDAWWTIIPPGVPAYKDPAFNVYGTLDTAEKWIGVIAAPSAPAAPGEVWTFQADVGAAFQWIGGSVAKPRIELRFYDASSTEVGRAVTETPIPAESFLGVGPYHLVVTKAAPAKTASVVAYVIAYSNYLGSSFKAGEFLYGNAILEKSATPGTYFDGDITPAPGTLVRWTGAPHSSTSEAGSLVEGDLEATKEPLMAAMLPRIPGSAPALARLSLIDNSGIGRATVEWGLDERVDPFAPVPALLEATDLIPLAGKVEAAPDGTKILRVGLTSAPVAISGSGPQRHIGSWRHKLRVLGAGSGRIEARLTYRIGSSPTWVTNPWTTLPAVGDFYELDLGLMRIPPPPRGERSCEWRVEARSTVMGDTLGIHLDQLIPSPYGRVSVSQRAPVTSVPACYDDFSQAAGVLNAKVAASGQAWATSGAGGGDIQVGNNRAFRAIVADPANRGGRFGLLGPETYAAVFVTLDITQRMPVGSGKYVEQAIIARWVDANNWVAHFRRYYRDTPGYPGTTVWAWLYKLKAGVLTATPAFAAGQGNLNSRRSIGLEVTADGRMTYFAATGWGLPYSTIISTSPDPDLATGGVLAKGRVGIYDSCNDASADSSWHQANPREYDNFVCSTAPVRDPDAAIHPGRSLEIGSDQVLHETPEGEWGRLEPEGSYLTIPANTLTRIIAKARRGEAGTPDLGVNDELLPALEVTPRVLLLGGER